MFKKKNYHVCGVSNYRGDLGLEGSIEGRQCPRQIVQDVSGNIGQPVPSGGPEGRRVCVPELQDHFFQIHALVHPIFSQQLNTQIL